MKAILHLPEVLQELVKKIEDHLDQKRPARERTLPVKIRKQKQNTIITWNIYPEPLGEIKKTLSNLRRIISLILEQPLDGELIYSEIKKGQILDAGINAFSIIQGYSWDLYLYQPEMFVYVRLVNETNLD
ncbi:MAG: hypothetical protein ACW98F_01340, partial [Candidatus Hodarchaeales archaeon]